MAPKKAPEPVAPPPVEEKEPEPQPEYKYGEFLLPNGASYCGEYIRTFQSKGQGPRTVANQQEDARNSSALEPLVDSTDKPLVHKDTIHGRGNYLFGPERFEGWWRNGEMLEGCYVFASNAIYEGSFLGNKFHGPGKYAWPDGKEYEGQFADGKMHGLGTFRNFTGAGSFTGTALRGHFQSNHVEQDEAKVAFVAEYGAPLLEAARKALADPEQLLVCPKLEKEWLAGHSFAAVEQRLAAGDLLDGETQEELQALVEEARKSFPELTGLLSGPFPTSADCGLVQQLAEALGREHMPEGGWPEGEEAPGKTTLTIVVDAVAAVRHAPLEYLGQCVELRGELGSCMLVNVGTSKGLVSDPDRGDPDLTPEQRVQEVGARVDDLVPGLAQWRLLSVTKAEES